VREALSQALACIEEREKRKASPPECVKAHVKKPQAEENKPRKKRDATHHHGRARAVSTPIVEHRIVTCPDGHVRLGGICLARVRAVSDVPPPPPVDVTPHRIVTGWCAPCQTWQEAPWMSTPRSLGKDGWECGCCV
jgi:hypothetical protein